jgi:pimeloyl-ACP methyl ester carboxylesterase
MVPDSSSGLEVAELPQGPLHYRAVGPTGPAQPSVIFLHGLLVDGRLWTAVADRLAQRGIRSYAPTLPLGSHRSAMNPDADLTPRGVARLVLDFADALGLDDVTLVGNDTGGAICQFILDTDAGRVGRVVLTNCDAFDKFPPPPFTMLVRAARHPGLVAAMAPALRSTRLRHSMLGFGPLANRPFDADLTRGWIEPLSDRAIRRDLAKLARGIDRRDLLDVSTRLDLFTKPVQLVWGDADRFFRLELGQRLAATFPNAMLTVVAGGRTFLPLDAPDRVAEVIEAATPRRTSGPARPNP